MRIKEKVTSLLDDIDENLPNAFPYATDHSHLSKNNGLTEEQTERLHKRPSSAKAYNVMRKPSTPNYENKINKASQVSVQRNEKKEQNDNSLSIKNNQTI